MIWGGYLNIVYQKEADTMFKEVLNDKKAASRLIALITCCIVIYLAIGNLDIIAKAVVWLADLVKPIIIGIILALVLNVPMAIIERKILKKSFTGRRSLAIVLALLLVIGIFAGVAILIIPELFNACKIIIDILTNGISQVATIEASMDFAGKPWLEYLAQIDINWTELQLQLENWLKAQSDAIANQAVEIAGSVTSGVVSAVLGLIFAIYILARKEILKAQVARLIRVWLPQKYSEGILHICDVCNTVFQRFVGGQALEAIILGSLCMIGMIILRIPYAPMVGALVGVTALIPIVGAIIGTIVGFIMISTVAPFKAIIFLIYLLILQQIEGHVIYPKVIGGRINLPAIWVLAAITIGGELGGPLGMFLGVPAMSVAYLLIKEYTNKREKTKQNKAVDKCEP